MKKPVLRLTRMSNKNTKPVVAHVVPHVGGVLCTHPVPAMLSNMLSHDHVPAVVLRKAVLSGMTKPV